MDRLYCAYEGPFCQYNDFATAEGNSDCDEACEYLKEIEATESAAPSGQAELPGCKAIAVGEVKETRLLWGALNNARPHSCGTSQRWVAIRDTFGIGSTSAYELCRLNGLDPDETVYGANCDSCNP